MPAALRSAAAPPGYEQRQPVFAKAIVPGDTPKRQGSPMSWTAFVDYRGMPDSSRTGAAPAVTRTHLNFTDDYPCTVAYLEDPAQRQMIDREMRLRTLQLLHYVQNGLGMRDWSVADDEGFDSPYNRAEIDAWLRERPELEPYRAILYHFSALPYDRESRRLVGLHTLVAREISRGPGKTPTQFPTTIALGDYRLDLHGGRAAADLELDLDRVADLEDAQPGRAGPFAIPFESLIPASLDGLLAAEKNYSQSRLVNGATRMQPHTMNVGQAVGALAALAVRHGVPPRRIAPVLVQRVLLGAGSTLNITSLQDVAQRDSDWPAIQLVTMHGLLALERGRFSPQRPVSRQELAAVLQQLGGRTPDAPAETAALTRAEFARALITVAGRDVKLAFTVPECDAGQPLTRSEAAQILAEFLELRALGQLSGAAQVLTWNTAQNATRVPGESNQPAGTRYLRRLLGAKVITDLAYWEENAVTGRVCDGARVAQLLTDGARFLDPAATTQTTLDVLLKGKVITARDYWAKTAVPGGHCAGKNVATVIRHLADHVTTSQR